VNGVISHVNRVHAPVLIYIVTIPYHPGCLKKSVNSVVKDLIKVDCVQVISQQLSRLQDMADKCKTLTKATEAQVSFFQQAHQLNRSLFCKTVKLKDFLLFTDLKPE
jgi:DNA-binding transcriptional regulator PaaX